MITATVLVTSAGSAAAVSCIRALRSQNQISIRLIAADASNLSAGLYEVDASYLVPRLEQHSYIDSLLAIAIKESVNVILPTFSQEIPVVARAVSLFQRNSINILISPFNIIMRFANKWSSYEFFKSNGFATPETQLGEMAPPALEFPFLMKPLTASGSKDCYKINSQSDFNFYAQRLSGFVVQPYLFGNEVTVDVLIDSNLQVIAAVPRLRVKIRDGMAVVSKTINNAELITEIERFASVAGIVGPANIQGFLIDNGFLFTDVNTRFSAGGLPLTIASGVNTPLMTVMLALGMKVDAAREYQTDLWMIRSHCETFVNDNDLSTVTTFS